MTVDLGRLVTELVTAQTAISDREGVLVRRVCCWEIAAFLAAPDTGESVRVFVNKNIAKNQLGDLFI